jgi:hypothetical protein
MLNLSKNLEIFSSVSSAWDSVKLNVGSVSRLLCQRHQKQTLTKGSVDGQDIKTAIDNLKTEIDVDGDPEVNLSINLPVRTSLQSNNNYYIDGHSVCLSTSQKRPPQQHQLDTRPLKISQISQSLTQPSPSMHPPLQKSTVISSAIPCSHFQGQLGTLAAETSASMNQSSKLHYQRKSQLLYFVWQREEQCKL